LCARFERGNPKLFKWGLHTLIQKQGDMISMSRHIFFTQRYPKLGLVDIDIGDGNFISECGCSGHIEKNGDAIIEKNCKRHKGLDMINMEWEADNLINLVRNKEGIEK
jgi:hypothetical protein